MKKLLFMLFAIVISITVNSQEKNYVSIECKVSNQKTDSLFIWGLKNGGLNLVKTLKLNKNGMYRDTLTVKAGMHLLSDTSNPRLMNTMYLANGFDLKLSFDANQLGQPMSFMGEGAFENIVFAQVPESFPDIALDSEEKKFRTEIDKAKKASLALIEGKKLASTFIEETKKTIDQYYNSIETDHNSLISINKLNNTLSPSFDFINYQGGKSKLEDFKGKYVYIDAWATWCGPCLAELPHLKKMEELYHNKNIVFVSISTDEFKDLEKWKKMINTKSMSGVQLLEDNRISTPFSKYYNINSIPRFILIDPKGVIIASDASRPSDPLLREKLDVLLK